MRGRPLGLERGGGRHGHGRKKRKKEKEKEKEKLNDGEGDLDLDLDSIAIAIARPMQGRNLHAFARKKPLLLLSFRLLGGLFLLALLFSRSLLSPWMSTPPDPSSSPAKREEVFRSEHADNQAEVDEDDDGEDGERKADENSYRFLLLTLEFRSGTFSGNGVYAKSIARSLARNGHQVLVVSARPALGIGPRPNYSDPSLRSDPQTGLIELEVDVEKEKWGRLDWKCPWRSFAQGMSSNVVDSVVLFDPDWVLVVDWSSLPAFCRLVESTKDSQLWRMAFLNFRIFYHSEYKGAEGEKEKLFYKDMESKAVSMASAVAALSSSDAHVLATELGGGRNPNVIPKILFPPLRKDIQSLAVGGAKKHRHNWQNRRHFFTCCVRLSPEKNADLFASLVESLTPFLKERGIVPFLCGGNSESSSSSSSYSTRIKKRVKASNPDSVVFEGFMNPSQLADVYSKTLLNMHPSVYDAYGMTIVESAAFAAPSIVHFGPFGAVGAAEFLKPALGQAVALDLTQPLAALSESIRSLLSDSAKLAQIGQNALKRSLAWDEDANAKQLLSILKAAPYNAVNSSSLISHPVQR